jgi:hypothetical protein
MTPAERRRVTPRTEKSIRLALAGLLAAIPGLIGIATGTVWLGYLAAAIVVLAILLGPVSERHFTR